MIPHDGGQSSRKQRPMIRTGDDFSPSTSPQLRPQPRPPATSGRLFAEPTQTLLFLDFDDTLFPTTDIFDRWGWPSNPKEWDGLRFLVQQEEQLSQWREALGEFLTTARAASEHVAIVTNAEQPWVACCVEQFAPELRELVAEQSGLRTVYAREVYAEVKSRHRRSAGRGTAGAAIHSGNAESREEQEERLTAAKFTAMRREAQAFYAQYPGQTWKNILSIGDARYEQHAAQELAFQRNMSPEAPERERIRLKVVVTPAHPTIADLTYHLRLSTLLLHSYVRFDDNIDLDMNIPDRLWSALKSFGLPELCAALLPVEQEPEDSPSVAEVRRQALDDARTILQIRRRSFRTLPSRS